MRSPDFQAGDRVVHRDGDGSRAGIVISVGPVGTASNGGRPMVRVFWDNGESSRHTDSSLRKLDDLTEAQLDDQ